MKNNFMYNLIYVDRKGNELTREKIIARSRKEANKTRDQIFAECMINDCKRIRVVKTNK